MNDSGIAVLVLSLMATIVAMAGPLAYPNTPIIVWRMILWIGIIGMVVAAIYLLMVGFGRSRVLYATAMAGGAILFVYGIVGFIGAKGVQSKAHAGAPKSEVLIALAENQSDAHPIAQAGSKATPCANGNQFKNITAGTNTDEFPWTGDQTPIGIQMNGSSCNSFDGVHIHDTKIGIQMNDSSKNTLKNVDINK